MAKRNWPYLPRDPIADKDGYVRSPAWLAWLTALARMFNGDPRNATMTWVSGTPEGNITASPGSMAAVTDAGGGALYIKGSGIGNTGWVGAAGVGPPGPVGPAGPPGPSGGGGSGSQAEILQRVSLRG